MIRIPDKYWLGTSLLRAGLPWLTPNAIQYLDSIVRPHFEVLEFGCGGSTVFFAKRCKNVVSVETDKTWAAKIAEKVKKLSSGVQIVVVDVMPETLSFIRDKQPWLFDIVLVDSDGKNTDRQKICESIIPHLTRNSYLILDNYGRYNIAFLDQWHWAVRCFDDPHWDGKGTLIAERI